MAKTATKPKRSTGRPKAVIDWNQVGKRFERWRDELIADYQIASRIRNR